MASKGMSMTLTIIVAAVVILVTALVLLTIFGTGITPVASIAEAKAQCTFQAETLCKTTGTHPPTWNMKTMNVGGELKSCEEVCIAGGCKENLAGDPRYTFAC